MGQPVIGAVGGNSGPPFETVRDQLQRLLASPAFADAPRLRSLLAFLVEQTLCGHAGEIKESVIAVEVFGRAPDFDPRADSVVRVQVRNLRAKLRAYYDQEGRDDRIRFDLPSGSYVPVFEASLPPAVAAPGVRPAWFTWRRAGWAAAGLAVAVAIGVVIISRTGLPWPATRRSVAVLPFLNLTGDTGKDYFVDGFVDELTTSLAQAKGLQVVARSSAFQFRGKSPDVRVAGRQLGVGAILEGSVSSAGGTVRVSAQLINAEDGFHVWSHTYSGAAEDVFTIRDQIARAVSGALDVSSPARTTAAAYRPDLEAYDLYLKGQYFKERVTLDDLGRSIQFFEQSVHRDPGFAAAYAALADVYATVAYHQVVPEKESIAKAKAAAARALELDPALAEAHAVLAWIQCFYDWDWVRGEPGLRRALELNPNSARTHDWYSEALLLAGRFDQAVAESKRALALDPLSYRVSGNIAVILYCAHRYDDAIRQARQTLEINPHYYQANTMLGTSLAEKKMYPEAAAALRAALADYPRDPDTMAHLAAVEASIGKRDEALKLMEELDHSEPKPYYHLAFLYAVLGDKDRAFDALDNAYAHRDGDMLSLNVDPAFDGLHADPRFAALWRKIGWR